MAELKSKEELTGRIYSTGKIVASLVSTKGAKGDKGEDSTIVIGDTTTGEPGTNAIVTNSGTNSHAILNFTIPKGEKGDRGEPGERGKDGTGVNILGHYETLAELQAAHPIGNVGDAYMIDANLYVWSPTSNSWMDVGNIQGERGASGVVSQPDEPTDKDICVWVDTDEPGEVLDYSTYVKEVEEVKKESHTHSNKSVLDSISQEKIDSWDKGGEIDLSSYAFKDDLPTKTSELTNDSGFITSIPDDVVRTNTVATLDNVVSRNLFDGETTNAYVYLDGSLATASDWIASKNYIKVKPNTTYIISAKTTATRLLYAQYKGITNVDGRKEITPGKPFTTSNDVDSIRFSLNDINATDIQLEEGSTATPYVPYLNLKETIITDSVARVSNVVSSNLYNKNNAFREGVYNQNIVNNISLKPNTSYFFKTGKTWTEIKLYDSDGNLTRSLGNSEATTEIQFNTSSNEVKGRFIFYAGTDTGIYDFTGIQLVEGSTTTSYAPYLNLEEAMQENNIYSTSERRIGISDNGKPRYRKVIKSTTPNATTTGTTVKTTIDVSSLNIYEIEDISSIVYQKPYSTYKLPYYQLSNSSLLLVSHSIENKQLEIVNSITWLSNCEIKITLEYTKTTD